MMNVERDGARPGLRDKLPRCHPPVRAPVFAAAVLAGAIVRLAALPLPGTVDMGSWKVWTFAASDQVTAVYGVGGSPPVRGVVRWGTRQTTVDYPPATLYVLAAVGHVYRAFAPDFPDSDALDALIKVPGLLATAGLSALFYREVRRRTGQVAPAQWAALACWLNPALILNGEALGYLDPLMMLPAVAALILADTGRWTSAGAAAALAMMIKPQGVLVLPVVALTLWSSGEWRALAKAALSGAALLVVLLLPFARAGALPNIWLAFGAFYERRDALSANAANLWWIVNWALRFVQLVPERGVTAALGVPVPHILTITRFQELGFPNPRPFATAAVGAACAWACWQARRRMTLAILAAAGAFTVHAFFVLMVGVHEPHQVLEIPLLALAAALCPAFRPAFYAISAIVALNLNLFYGISRTWGWAVPRTATVIDATVILAVVNLLVFAWLARTLLREA